MPEQFKGVIKLDVRDSKPDWTPLRSSQSARRRAERPVRPLRRHRSGGVVALRRPDQHADAADRLADNGLTYTQWHTTALCSPTRSTLPDRAQPPPERHGLQSRRAPTGSPGWRGRIPPQCAHHRRRSCRKAASAPSGSARTTTFRSRTSPRAADRKTWPLAPGLRPLLRLPRRRDQPVVSGPGRGQPLHRAAVHARGGLPPLQGPGRSGDQDDPRPEGRQPVASRGSCGSAPAPTTPRTTPRRSTSTSTRASSTTATRPTASGCCRA